MDEKKTRRRPNFFDILVIVLLLLIAAGAYVVSHMDELGLGRKEVVTRSYLVELAGMEPGMETYCQVGDEVSDVIKNHELGVITDMEVIPTTLSVLDEEAGIIRQVPQPDRVTILITVDAETVEDEDSIDTVDGYILQEGAPITIEAGELVGSGYILRVDR